MKKIILSVFIGLCSISSYSQKISKNIHLNQVGFYPDAGKIAVIVNSNATKFLVKKEGKNKPVFEKDLPYNKYDPISDDSIKIADFSKVTKKGIYYIEVPGLGKSYTFEIKKNIHKEVAIAALKSYYYQRASTELTPEFAGKWSRAAGHPDNKVVVHASAATDKRPEGTVISCPKGWYDAGDYGKYIVNSGISTATILSLYEDFPEYMNSIKTNIPESNDNIPDVLDEILWNIRWMLTMQDPDDGGVYHKLTTANFQGMDMPNTQTATRYVIQKSTAATLDFAAVMAQASRVFQKFEKDLPGLSDSCITMAKKAWDWAIKNPNVYYNQDEMNKNFDPAINTGGYGDSNVEDEFVWAACELYVTTKDESYYKSVDVFKNGTAGIPGWSNVGTMGFYTLVRFKNELSGKPKSEVRKAESAITDMASRLMKLKRQSAYEVVMSKSSDFGWGSNSQAANQAILLIYAYKISELKECLTGALSNIDYLLGRNATGYSFITGYGDKTPMHIHHRPSESDGIEDPIPGLIAGGPNPGMQDNCKYPSDFPAKAYVDVEPSYASNEVAINWNAPLTYILFAIEALQKDL